MICSKLHATMIAYLEEGIDQARNIGGEQVLVSSVCKINKTDLPAFFSYEQPKFKGERFYWSEPERTLTYVGLGQVYTIEAQTVSDRFQLVDRKWKQLTSSVMVKGEQTPYTGPILFGGFSFDPYIEQSEKWSDFTHTSFAVPKYMITCIEEQYYLTCNVMVTPHHGNLCKQKLDELQQLFEYIETENMANRRNVAVEKPQLEEIAPSDFVDAIDKAATSVREGLLEKVVLARSIVLEAKTTFHIEDTLRHLLEEQHNTYVFAIDKAESCFVGATPERLIKRQGEKFLTLSLAGSIARGQQENEDKELASFLSHDLKNLHEHALAVDMIKGAMEQLCSTIEAPSAPIIRKLKDIQHLATPISGDVKEGVTLLQAVEALHPTPALGGMPREAALDAIRALEQMDRGWYAAPIGWMNCQLEGEFAAAIRSALLSGERAYLFAGCGVVGDSDPLSEYKETALKFRPMLNALNIAFE